MEHIFQIEEPDAATTLTAITITDKTIIITVVTIQGETDFVENVMLSKSLYLNVMIAGTPDQENITTIHHVGITMDHIVARETLLTWRSWLSCTGSRER